MAAAGNGAVSPTADPSNGTGDALNYPADDAGVVAVGATGGDGLRASYSNTGAYVGMAAPGGSDISLDPGDDLGVLAPTDQCRPLQTPTCYTTGAGTGLAAAQVSAEAALIWAVNPPGAGAPPSGLTASQVRELVESTTTDQGVTGRIWSTAPAWRPWVSRSRTLPAFGDQSGGPDLWDVHATIAFSDP